MAGILTSHSGLRPEAKRYVMAGRGVVVDIAGRGDFVTIQDAVDFCYARGGTGGHIWIRNGTYYENVLTANTHNNLVIEGESWDTLIDGETSGHAIEATSDVHIKSLQVQTTGGGGTQYDGINMSSATWYQIVEDCLCLDSDGHGIEFSSSNVVIRGCWMWGCDEDGIRLAGAWSKVMQNQCNSNGANGIGLPGTGDNACITGNQLISNASYGIIIGASDDNCVIVGNRATGNSSGNINDGSSTSTVTGNDTT